MPDGGVLDIAVPEGVADGQTLRLKGQGAAGPRGGEAGDALVEIKVRPHALFKRSGDDIVLELPITIDEAVLGAKIEVPTISGRVQLTVPKGTSSGRVFRLKGKGVRNTTTGNTGDQLVTVRIVLPETIDRRSCPTSCRNGARSTATTLVVPADLCCVAASSAIKVRNARVRPPLPGAFRSHIGSDEMRRVQPAIWRTPWWIRKMRIFVVAGVLLVALFLAALERRERGLPQRVVARRRRHARGRRDRLGLEPSVTAIQATVVHTTSPLLALSASSPRFSCSAYWPNRS